MTDTREIRIAALVGALGALIAVASDVPTVFSTTGAEGLVHVGQLGTVEGLDPLLRSKSRGELVVGHALGLVGHPLAMIGLWAVYRAIRPAGRRVALVTLLAGVYAHVLGTIVHVVYPFLVVGIQARAALPAGSQVGDRLVRGLNVFYEPLGTIALVAFLVAIGAFGYAVWARETAYPRWFAVANPVTFLAVVHAVAFVAPTPLRVFLIVAGLNLSLFAFYALSASLLWRGDFAVLEGGASSG